MALKLCLFASIAAHASRQAKAAVNCAASICKLATESLKFVAQHDFDFNVWIKQGCGYLSRQEEEMCRARIAAEYAKKVNDGKDESFAQEARVYNELMTTAYADIRRWMLTDNVQSAMSRGGPGIEAIKDIFSQGKVVPSADMPCFVTKEYDAYRRKIIHNDFAPQFPEFLFETVDDDDAADNRRRGKSTRVLFLGPPPAVQTAKLERINSWLQRQQRAVTTAVGVRRIIDAVAAAKLPIVGHNCYVDLMHIYAKFVGNLPPLLGDWCCRMNQSFPAIFDTKHLLSCSHLRELLPDSTLDAAHMKLEELSVAKPKPADEATVQDAPSASKVRHFPSITRAVLGSDSAASAAHEAGTKPKCSSSATLHKLKMF